MKMWNIGRYWVLLAFAGTLFAQPHIKQPVRIELTIKEDRMADQIHPGLCRVLVSLTNISNRTERQRFHEEALGMYDMIVKRAAAPVRETIAMQALRRYRELDNNQVSPNDLELKTGENWVTPLDVSDYFDMSQPGDYQVTVTRQSLPMNLEESNLVTSNTIFVHMSGGSLDATKETKPWFDLVASNVSPEDGGYVAVQVELENKLKRTAREVRCWTSMGMYNLIVFRDGEQLEANDMLRMVDKNQASVACLGNETLLEVIPGEPQVDEIPVSNYFDFSSPGSYTIYITRKTFPWNPAKSVTVESNPVNIVIAPQPAEPDDEDNGVASENEN